MNAYATALENARVKVGAKAGKFLPDTCSIISPNATETRDSGGEPTYADETIASLVPCSYVAMSTFERVAGGASGNAASHKLRMPVTASTLLIKSDDRLVVNARGTTPALTFEVTGRLDSSTSLLLEVAAVLKG